MKHLSTSLDCTYKVCYRIFPCVLLTALHRRLVEIKYKKFATRRIMWTYGLNLLYAIAITATFILFGDSGNATIDTITVNCYKIYSCLVFRQWPPNANRVKYVFILLHATLQDISLCFTKNPQLCEGNDWQDYLGLLFSLAAGLFASLIFITYLYTILNVKAVSSKSIKPTL